MGSATLIFLFFLPCVPKTLTSPPHLITRYHSWTRPKKMSNKADRGLYNASGAPPKLVSWFLISPVLLVTHQAQIYQ